MSMERNGGIEKSQFGLAPRLFASFALLALLTLGTAAGVTVLRGNAVAERVIESQVEHSRSVQAALEHDRFVRLELIAELFASDPYFASYVAEAQRADLGFGGGADTASVIDLLAERQAELGFDFALVLGAQGNVIARTDGRPVGRSLATDTVVGPVIASLESNTGYWSQGDGVFQVAAVPLPDGFELAGFLVAGLAMNDALAEALNAASGAQFLIMQSSDDQWRVAAGTPEAAVSSELVRHIQSNGLPEGPTSLELGGHRWRVAATPLDASSAFAVTLTDEDGALAGYRAIQAVLAVAALGALAAAVVLGWTIASSIARPVRELAEAADAAADGNYHEEIPASGGRELGQLTAAFNRLLSNLREKRDMERFLADLARLQPEPGEKSLATDGQTATERGYLVGLRWKEEAVDVAGGEDTVRRIEEIANVLARCSAVYRGRVLELAGNSAVLWLPGAQPPPAIVLAGKSVAELQGLRLAAVAALMPADTTLGEALAAGVRRQVWHSAGELPLRQLLLEARPGHVLLTRQVGETAKQSGLEPAVIKGQLTGKAFFAVTTSAAVQMGVSDDDQTMAFTQVAGASTTAAATQLRPGIVFARRFDILSELGRGGMGAVFKAMDRELKEPVALKVLLGGTAMNAAERESMKSEIRLARRITHPNILRTHDFGEFDGIPFITMEYVRGMTLKFLVQQSGRLPDSAALRIARQVCSGLQAAHEQGVLHRDIKPENVILEPTGNAKLMDFGIAQVVVNGSSAQVNVAGTPRYAAPEQMLGRPLDARADIYSLGVLMYQMFTGQLPFRAHDIDALVRLKQEGNVVFPAGEMRPAGLEELLRRCMAGDVVQRPATAADVLVTLESIRT